MTNAEAISAAPPHHETASLTDRLELFGRAVAVRRRGVRPVFDRDRAAVADLRGALLAAAARSFGTSASRRRGFSGRLLAYGGVTLISAAFSSNRAASFVDSKQLVLFLLVPVAYRLLSDRRGSLMLTLVMSLGGASAAFGIFQYGLLHFDQLSQRPQGTLGHYMTYAGLLMLVIGIALAKILFGRGERLWAALADAGAGHGGGPDLDAHGMGRRVCRRSGAVHAQGFSTAGHPADSSQRSHSPRLARRSRSV